MKNRFRKEEKQAVNSRYGEEWLFRMLCNPGRRFEREAGTFRLSAEELYAECAGILDKIKERDTADAELYVSGLWDELFCTYRDIDTGNATDEDLQMAVSAVLYGVIMCLGLSDRSKYATLCGKIMMLLHDPEHPAQVQHLHDVYMQTYWRLNSAELQTAFEDYMRSERFISDEIEDMLYAPQTDIGDGLTPCLPHRFRFCREDVTNERAKEINRTLWEYCREKDAKRVLLLLRGDFQDDIIDPNGIESADLYRELHYCYGLDSIKERQFTNLRNRLLRRLPTK